MKVNNLTSTIRKIEYTFVQNANLVRLPDNLYVNIWKD